MTLFPLGSTFLHRHSICLSCLYVFCTYGGGRYVICGIVYVTIFHSPDSRPVSLVTWTLSVSPCWLTLCMKDDACICKRHYHLNKVLKSTSPTKLRNESLIMATRYLCRTSWPKWAHDDGEGLSVALVFGVPNHRRLDFSAPHSSAPNYPPNPKY